jgi:capsule polysaccharide export protein KpsE/RkpR
LQIVPGAVFCSALVYEAQKIVVRSPESNRAVCVGILKSLGSCTSASDLNEIA